MDSRGVVIISDEMKAKFTKMGVIATEPAGSVRPCMMTAHMDMWYRRPWPMGDIACPVCTPDHATLEAEGYPKTKNIVPERAVGRHINPPVEKWERATSDLAGQIDPKSVLFGDDLG